ncbi:MAG: SHOCT domain-containing protein [Halobacteriota archaeon]
MDVTEQIKKLGELRDQGLLTEQEFGSKKQELLARM